MYTCFQPLIVIYLPFSVPAFNFLVLFLLSPAHTCTDAVRACLSLSSHVRRKALAGATQQAIHRREATIVGCSSESFMAEDGGTWAFGKFRGM